MPNNLLVNPVIINSLPMAASYKAATATQGPAGLGLFSYLRIEKVIWESPAAVGNIVAIKDPASGAILLPMTCEAAGSSPVFDWTAKPRRWSDFIVTNLDSGTLYIYLA